MKLTYRLKNGRYNTKGRKRKRDPSFCIANDKESKWNLESRMPSSTENFIKALVSEKVPHEFSYRLAKIATAAKDFHRVRIPM